MSESSAPTSPEHRIDAVVLDYGNVLCTWRAEAAIEGVVEAGQWAAFEAEGGFGRWNRALDAGAPLEEVLGSIARHHPDRPHWPGLLRAYWEGFGAALTGPVPGTGRIVEELLARGTALYALTNFNDVLFARHGRARVAALERFAGIVVSGEEGLVKPDPAIYRRLLGRYGLGAQDTLFVDDSEANVVAARELGMAAHLFTGAAGLRRELVARGLLESTVD